MELINIGIFSTVGHMVREPLQFPKATLVFSAHSPSLNSGWLIGLDSLCVCRLCSSLSPPVILQSVVVRQTDTVRDVQRIRQGLKFPKRALLDKDCENS